MMICPVCCEPAINVPPTALGGRGEWSHEDGEPLCPVMGYNGYEPAMPDEASDPDPN